MRSARRRSDTSTLSSESAPSESLMTVEPMFQRQLANLLAVRLLMLVARRQIEPRHKAQGKKPSVDSHGVKSTDEAELLSEWLEPETSPTERT